MKLLLLLAEIREMMHFISIYIQIGKLIIWPKEFELGSFTSKESGLMFDLLLLWSLITP